MNAVLLPALLLVCAADDKVPEPKLPLGKDTTYVIGPLDKHGYIDYEAALNAEMSKGITSENNANALLVYVFGPTPEGAELPAAYYKWLGVPAPETDADYLVNFNTFNKNHLRLAQAQLEAFFEFQSRATKRVWAAKDCEPLADWLKVNEAPLARVHEAVKRAEYFNPLVSKKAEGESSNLIGALLPTVQKCRELASLLSARATLRLGEKKYDEAWADVLACHRLGRLVARGATLIEALVGIAICQVANAPTLAYLERADLTAEQTLGRLKELRALPPMKPLYDKIDVAERMMGLDALQLVRRGGAKGLNFVFEDNAKPSDDELKALAAFDWAPVMQTMNAWYDRLAAAMRIKDRGARNKAFEQIEADLQSVKKEVVSPDDFLKLLTAKDGKRVTGKRVGDVLAGLLLPAVRKVEQAYDRNTQAERNLHVAFALAAYHKDTAGYPAQLADLAPKYLPAVPDDVFAGKPLIYKPNAKGYLFYSVGPNGQDDGGRWYDDDPPGDDPGVRMPLPELKKK